MKANKGGRYEREVCRALSMWWTDGARDDVFWRTSASGARATARGKRGRDTAGQHGDVAATDPSGAPLIDAFTIEIKRGYHSVTLHDLLDRPEGAKLQGWEGFVSQAMEGHERAGSYAWLLITRRDRRKALIWTPFQAVVELRGLGAFPRGLPTPRVRTMVRVRSCHKELRTADVFGLLLADWFAAVSPGDIRRLIGSNNGPG